MVAKRFFILNPLFNVKVERPPTWLRPYAVSASLSVGIKEDSALAAPPPTREDPSTTRLRCGKRYAGGIRLMVPISEGEIFAEPGTDFERLANSEEMQVD
jgi:hypothetical protein